MGIKPVIKQRKCDENPKRYRKKALELFDEEAYKKFRGAIEGIFSR